MSGALIALTFLLLVTRAAPYDDDDDDMLSFITTLQIMLTLLMGFALKTQSLESGEGEYEDNFMGLLLVGTSVAVFVAGFCAFVITFPTMIKPLSVVFCCLKNRMKRLKKKHRDKQKIFDLTQMVTQLSKLSKSSKLAQATLKKELQKDERKISDMSKIINQMSKSSKAAKVAVRSGKGKDTIETKKVFRTNLPLPTTKKNVTKETESTQSMVKVRPARAPRPKRMDKKAKLERKANKAMQRENNEMKVMEMKDEKEKVKSIEASPKASKNYEAALVTQVSPPTLVVPVKQATTALAQVEEPPTAGETKTNTSSLPVLPRSTTKMQLVKILVSEQVGAPGVVLEKLNDEIVVKRVMPDGLAMNAGITKGDVLVRIGGKQCSGKKLRKIETWVRSAKFSKQGKEFVFGVSLESSGPS